MHMKDKAMILAPHQDDEIIACAGTINLLKELGLEVFIVFATNGDSGGREGASIRLKESTTVLKRLGISEKNIIILGFADTGMDYDNSFLWNLYHSPESKILKSLVTDRTYHPFGENEYSVQKLGIHLPYTRAAFLQILKILFEEMEPKVVFTSSRLDMHGDHAALGLFVEEIIEKIQLDTAVYQYLIHSGNDEKWPKRRTMYFERPDSIPEELWSKRTIVPVSELINKRQLIGMFKSQMSPIGSEYLLSFAKCEEIFFELQGH